MMTPLNREQYQSLVKKLTELLETPNFVLMFDASNKPDRHQIHMISSMDQQDLKQFLQKVVSDL